MKLEVIVIPVSDVDCAKEFYARPAGLDADRSVRAGVPLIQFTPPGSTHRFSSAL
jgi:extradiol dioxygenase family protein